LAARGIDIPEVDWIVQFDPPQWSDSFVHRIGRTARAGRSGQSLLLLMKNEGGPYIEYLRNKQVEINELPEVKQTVTTAEIDRKVKKDLLLRDKGLVDKATAGFTSYCRYYKEHQLSFIFAFKTLDIGHVANSFFLFRLPRVKEILGRRIESFTQCEEFEGIKT